jgi:hypothetical protein
MIASQFPISDNTRERQGYIGYTAVGTLKPSLSYEAPSGCT